MQIAEFDLFPHTARQRALPESGSETDSGRITRYPEVDGPEVGFWEVPSGSREKWNLFLLDEER